MIASRLAVELGTSGIYAAPLAYPFNSRSVTMLPLGQGQTDQTVAAMFTLASSATKRGGVQRIAEQVCAGNNQREAVEQLFAWLRRTVRFLPDDIGDEELKHPDQLIATIADHGFVFADCKKLATLAVALLTAIGSRPVLAVVKQRTADDWEHVLACYQFSETDPPMPFDPQESPAPGIWPRGAYQAQVYNA